MANLFNEQRPLNLPDSDIIYYPSFLSQDKASRYFEIIKQNTEWQQDDITVFGKTYPQPRLTALFANNTKPYSYSNITMHPSLFTKELNDNGAFQRRHSSILPRIIEPGLTPKRKPSRLH